MASYIDNRRKGAFRAALPAVGLICVLAHGTAHAAGKEESALPDLKNIPVADQTTLSLGGEFRERAEAASHPEFGREGVGGNSYLLQRATVSAELESHDMLRAFLQLGSWVSAGRRPEHAATDDDGLDVAQAYVDLHTSVDGWKAGLQPGRQEITFGASRLFSVRNSPNIRRSFDAVRGYVAGDGARVDVFAARPVSLTDGAFDNESDNHQRVFGAYATLPVAGMKTDLYYVDYARGNAKFSQGTASEARRTIGARLYGRGGGFDWDVEGDWQFGSFGADDIGAWMVATNTGYTFETVAWTPRLGLKTDIASGDRNASDGRLGTFNAMYPKLKAFSEAALVAPANLINLQPVATVKPAKGLTLLASWGLLWRETTADGFYTSPMTPVANTTGGDRYIGNQAELAAEWSPTPWLDLGIWYVHFTAGDTIEKAGGRDEDYIALSSSLHF